MVKSSPFYFTLQKHEIFSLTPMFLKAKLQLDISVFWSNVLDTPWAISIWQFRLSHFVGNIFPFPSFFFLFSLFGKPISWLYQRNYYSWFSYLFIASFYLWIFCSTFWKSPLLNRLMLLLGFSFLLSCLLSFMKSFLFPRNTFLKKASSLYYSIVFHLFENTNENGYLRFPFPVIVSLSSKFSLCKFICTLTSRLEDFLTNWNYL